MAVTDDKDDKAVIKARHAKAARVVDTVNVADEVNVALVYHPFRRSGEQTHQVDHMDGTGVQGYGSSISNPKTLSTSDFRAKRTEQVLWRLHNRALEHLAPRLTILLIRTNDTGQQQDPPEETAAGIKATLTKLQRRLPKSKTLLLAVLPYGMRSDNQLRKINAAINDLIVDLADGQAIHCLDFGEPVVRTDGRPRIDLMPDELHLNLDGYQQWADHLLPRVDALLV